MLSQRINGVFASPLERSRLALVGTLLALAAVGWALTGDRMAGMDGGPGTDLGSLGFYVTAWVVMMSAMMFPSIAPMVIVYNRIHTRLRERDRFAPPGSTAVFVGCCWALMAALFAVGVMSVGWMLFVAALIATEKMLPWKEVANRSVALLLVVLGLAVAFAPERVPGLTIPSSMGMHRSMQMNGSMRDDSTKQMDR